MARQVTVGFRYSTTGYLRGDGCFEAIRSYDGRPFAMEEHYRRLAASAGALGIPVPTAADLGAWVERVAAGGGDCIVRVVLTRGETVPGRNRPSRCVVMSHPIPPSCAELPAAGLAPPGIRRDDPGNSPGSRRFLMRPTRQPPGWPASRGHDDALLTGRFGDDPRRSYFHLRLGRGRSLETAGLDTGNPGFDHETSW